MVNIPIKIVMKTKDNARSGFTFLELVIVISIIGVLSAMFISSYSSTIKKSRDAKRRGDIEEIRSALEVYRISNGGYPLSLNGLLAPTVYLQRLPADPLSGQGYSYRYEPLVGCDNSLTLCTTYKIGAKLESAHTCLNPLTLACYGTTSCNYCLGPYGEFTN